MEKYKRKTVLKYFLKTWINDEMLKNGENIQHVKDRDKLFLNESIKSRKFQPHIQIFSYNFRS